MSPFSAHFSGAPKSEGFCFQSERLLYGREPNGEGRNRESRSREAAGRRNWPEAVPRKNVLQKKESLELSDNRTEAELWEAPLLLASLPSLTGVIAPPTTGISN